MVSLLDKSWMMKGKATREYFQGCKDFVEFAWANKPAEYGTKIYCPCVRCNNQLFKRKDEVLDHIRRVGILRNYSCWTKHGESEVVNLIANDGDDMHGMLRDAFTAHSSVEEDSRVLDEPNVDEYHSNICISDEPNKDAQTFFKYLKEAETPLFPGSTKSTNLSFLVRLLLDKCINGWSNKSFDMLLKTLTDSLPDDLNMPKNYYEAKKLLKDLGMEWMHAQMIVCCTGRWSWVGTFFNIEGKTKDGLKARQDMEIMGIRGSLHAIPREGNKFYIPPACYTLSLQEKKKICQFLHDVKVPDSYSSNISRHVQVKQCKILGLKSHDWHVFVVEIVS